MIRTKYLFLAATWLLSACVYGSADLGGGKYTQATAITGQGGTYKIGNPYKIMGKWYYPKEDYNYSEVGMASWYGDDFHARTTANGEMFDMNSLTAAHRTLPLPSIVRVTNLENGRSLVLRVNDRGPYAKGRIIDVSKRASQLLGFHTQGTTKVRVEIMPKESKALKAAILGEELPAETEIVEQEPAEAPVQIGEAGNSVVYPKGSYFVQAGSYSLQSGAQNVAARLNAIGNTNIYYVNINGENYYRVRIGPFGSESEAAVALSKVQNNGIYDAKIVTD